MVPTGIRMISGQRLLGRLDCDHSMSIGRSISIESGWITVVALDYGLDLTIRKVVDFDIFDELTLIDSWIAV